MRETVLPLVTSAPHDSDDLKGYRQHVRLSEWEIGEFSDKYTGDIAYHPQAIANLRSSAHRALVDLNRARTASDLFRSHDFHGNTIWEKKLPQDERQRLVSGFYTPYYKDIDRAIRYAASFGFQKVLLVDVHDTGDFSPETGERDRKLPNEERSMPTFVVSNFGAPHTATIEYSRFENSNDGFVTAPAEPVIELGSLLAAEFGLEKADVEINTSFKGGNIVQYFGSPEYAANRGIQVWAIQIEHNRALTLDQRTREPRQESILWMNEKYNRIMTAMCESHMLGLTVLKPQ